MAESVGSGEVGFAAAHLGDFLDEVDQAVVAGEHEGVDHDAGALAFVDFFERLADDERIEAEGVFVDAAVFERQRGRLAVGDHDDLAHVFFLAKQDALRHAQSFAGVGVIRADLHASKFADGNFFRAVVKKHEIQRVAGILRSNQVRQRHRDALRGREAVLAVENHAVAAIEQHDRGARAVVLALMHHQILVADFDRNFRAVAPHRVEQRFADVEIQGVAEFVRARSAAGLDAGREIASVVAPKAASAERAERSCKRLEAEKVDGLVGDFEARFGFALLRLADLARALVCGGGVICGGCCGLM